MAIMTSGATFTAQTAHHFAQEWINAWNARDLDRVLAHYTDDVELSSPFVAEVAGNPSGVVRGKPALRDYWRKALAQYPDLRFILISVGVGVSSISIRYRSVLDLIATEVLTFNASGKISRASVHYTEPDLAKAKASHDAHAAWLWVSHITPILNISNFSESLAWFEKLGFRTCWQWGTPPTFGAVGSGETQIFLCLGAQGGRGKSTLSATGGPGGSDDQERGVWMSVWVDDVDAVHRRCIEKGLEVTFPPTDEPWGVREMHVRHPDGHVLRISRGINH